MNRSIFVLFIFLIATSCEKATYVPMEIPEDRDDLPVLVKKALEAKYEKYRSTNIKHCKKRVLKDAVKYVDSIIAEDLSLPHLEDVDFPRRPQRPRLPEGIILNDSLEANPM